MVKKKQNRRVKLALACLNKDLKRERRRNYQAMIDRAVDEVMTEKFGSAFAGLLSGFNPILRTLV